MKKDRYVVFANIEQAEDFVAILDAERGSTDRWDTPTEHPFDDRTLVAWCDVYLERQAHLLAGQETITPQQARQQGWHFHPLFKGAFAKARLKLEEAQFLLDGLHSIQAQPNFPAYTALFFSFLSALYALKEALAKTCKKLGEPADAWWESQFRKIQGDPIVGYLYRVNNDQKHGVNAPPLQVTSDVFGVNLQPSANRIMHSAEGAFAIAHEGTAQERRVPLEGLNGRMTVQLLSPDGSALGDASSLAESTLRFYEDMTFEARQRFDRTR